MASAFHGFQGVDNELMKQDAEIEKLTLGNAIRKCREHNIDCRDISGINELRMKLKLKLLCKTTRKEVGGFYFRFVCDTVHRNPNNSVYKSDLRCYKVKYKLKFVLVPLQCVYVNIFMPLFVRT